MKVKRFVAPNMQEAMMKVKMDMGKDAIILHTRKYKEGGFFGLFGRTVFEVTAAIEDHPLHTQVAVSRSLTNITPNPSQEANIASLQLELKEMKHIVQKMAGHIENTDEPLENVKNELELELMQIKEHICENEIEETLAEEILARVSGKLKHIEDDIELEVLSSKTYQLLQKDIGLLLDKPEPILLNDSCQCIALVGPTGVGKTTTIAKLAASFSLLEKKEVALVTADTYRIAAVDQLKTLGDIMGLPIDVAYTPGELKECIKRHQDKDLVLIDTAGRSHKNAMQMSELRAYLDAAEPTDVILVLSANTKYKDMQEVLESYADIPFSRIIFTKLDETSSCGAILNIVSRYDKKLCYVTAGQNVPDDIEVADPAKLATMMVRER